MSDIFQDNINAVTAKIENSENSSIYEENLANVIIETLENETLRENLKQYSRRTYEEKYSIEKGIERLSKSLI